MATASVILAGAAPLARLTARDALVAVVRHSVQYERPKRVIDQCSVERVTGMSAAALDSAVAAVAFATRPTPLSLPCRNGVWAPQTTWGVDSIDLAHAGTRDDPVRVYTSVRDGSLFYQRVFSVMASRPPVVVATEDSGWSWVDVVPEPQSGTDARSG